MNLSLSEIGVTAEPDRQASPAIIRLLNQHRPVGSEFVIHYLPYGTSRRMLGIATGHAHAARSTTLVDLYAEEIRWVVSLFRQASLTCPSGTPVPVYIMDPSGCSDLEPSPQVITSLPVRGRRNTFGIVLPNRTGIPNEAAERDYFRAAAVHEITHVICFSQAQLNTVPWNGWRWFRGHRRVGRAQAPETTDAGQRPEP